MAAAAAGDSAEKFLEKVRSADFQERFWSRTRLTNRQIVEIRRLFDTGLESQTSIAKMHGIQRIASNARWHFSRSFVMNARIASTVTTCGTANTQKIVPTATFWLFAAHVAIVLGA